MASFRRYLANDSISGKLLTLLISVTVSLVLIACGALTITTYLISKEYNITQPLHQIEALFGNPVLITYLLESPETSKPFLANLSSLTSLQSLNILDANKTSLLSYQNTESQPELSTEQSQLAVYLPQKKQTVTLVLAAKPSLSNVLVLAIHIAILAIIATAGLICILAIRRVKHIIIHPILHLIEQAHTISDYDNYNVRATKFNNDEIGILATSFNKMLNKVQARDQQLINAKDQAEKASQQAQTLALETQRTNKKLALEVQVRTHIEQKLTDLKKYLSDIIDSMPSALIAIEQSQHIQQWNKQASTLFGITESDACGKSVYGVITCLKKHQDTISKALALNQAQTIEKVAIKHPSQEVHYFDIVVYPLTYSASANNSSKKGAVIRLDDITQRLFIEEAIVQNEKMISVGGLAAGMAHEINNPLGGIVHNAQNIQRRLSPSLIKNQELAARLHIDIQSLNQYLEERGISRFLNNIQDAGQRASKIVNNMLQFSRRSNRVLQPTQLNTLITRTLEIAHSDLAIKQSIELNTIKIRTYFDPLLDKVPCISNEIEQVLLNLIKNAAYAIHQRSSPLTEGLINIKTERKEQQALIIVEDNGVGMTADVRTRIFEPFFTTKEVGSGTGLGLSVSYFIITNNHKGQMQVRSTPTEGTRFTISLPLAASIAA
ncbi:HAMP domain-containing sensor histidine kinase [Zooshikella ganghwensis]|uniref:histidine kinase n=1 Tax=Zooshikella ganghwensis TaxID=202772 RepID=A0A4P9VTM6_9GAMM|nr:HAMP domain-containing sensor histidine kinase [Zooshikella ganghwensis]RDH45400.1 HAMP domain-containing protein [Zooshikella ganghwensis]